MGNSEKYKIKIQGTVILLSVHCAIVNTLALKKKKKKVFLSIQSDPEDGRCGGVQNLPLRAKVTSPLSQGPASWPSTQHAGDTLFLRKKMLELSPGKKCVGAFS